MHNGSSCPTKGKVYPLSHLHTLEQFRKNSSEENDQVQQYPLTWRDYFNQNNIWFNVVGLVLSNFTWRLLELSFSKVERGVGVHTIAPTAYKVALPTALGRTFIELLKKRAESLRNNRSFNYREIANTITYSFLHFYIAYMGWDIAYEGGDAIKIDNVWGHLAKNACFSGAGYAGGELIAQMTVLGLDYCLMLCGVKTHIIDDVYGNASVIVERNSDRGCDSQDHYQNGLQVSSTGETDAARLACPNYFTTRWNYAKSVILFFSFALLSDTLESQIDDPDNRFLTALGQAAFVAVSLFAVEMSLTSIKTSYSYLNRSVNESVGQLNGGLFTTPNVTKQNLQQDDWTRQLLSSFSDQRPHSSFDDDKNERNRSNSVP